MRSMYPEEIDIYLYDGKQDFATEFVILSQNRYSYEVLSVGPKVADRKLKFLVSWDMPHVLLKSYNITKIQNGKSF